MPTWLWYRRHCTVIERSLDDLSLRQLSFLFGFCFGNALMNSLPFQPLVDPPPSLSVAGVRRSDNATVVVLISDVNGASIPTKTPATITEMKYLSVSPTSIAKSTIILNFEHSYQGPANI